MAGAGTNGPRAALAKAKLADIDARVATLARARFIVEWGMRCTCPSIDDCSCGVHPGRL
jgi:hypothetical protein